MKTDPEQTAAFAAVHEISRRDLLGHVFEESAAEIYAFDAGNLRFVAVNMAGRAALGKGMRQLTQLRADDLLTGMSSARLAMLLHNIARRRSACARLRTRKLRPTSEGVICDIKVRYLAGPVPTYLASVHDVPDPAAACVNGSLRAAIDALADGFVLYDKDDRLVLCNDRYRQIYASSAPIITPGARFEDILRDGLKHNQYADAIGREDVWLASRLQAHAVSDHMIEQEQTSGQWLRIEERKTRDGGRVGMRMDITQLKRDQAALERVARTDELTGLLNRRGLLEQMRNLVGDLARDQRIAVLHVDLDKFKSINDAHGHDAGDFVLRHCARLLKKGIAENHHVARFGGDEFIVAISTSQSDACVVALAEGLIAGLSLPVSFCNRICSFGASIGVAFYTPHLPDTLENVLTGADIALNAAKRAGRGECHVFEVRMRDAAVRSVEMAEDIRSGLYAGEFAPYFQPQIDTETDEIIGFEALIRWCHPDKGLIPAAQFIGPAEQAGLMNALDHVVMDKSCAAIRALIDHGVKNPRISINISTAQLCDPNVSSRLQCHMDAHGVSQQHLRLELLETTLLDERSSVIVENVHRLIAHGFSVELDDFGTGYAAIGTLRKFVVSQIKLDRSLVADIDRDPELQMITGALIHLAAQLGIKTLGEGVETTAEQGMLEKLGCYRAQGFLHAHPMPLDRLMAWIDQRTA